jgi:hypothetical protein
MSDKCKVLLLWVPFDVDLDSIVKMFKLNRISVDDCCTVSSRGKLIGLWIDKNDFESEFTNMSQHTGQFM